MSSAAKSMPGRKSAGCTWTRRTRCGYAALWKPLGKRQRRSAPRLPGLCVLMLLRASSQPGLPGPMRLVPPGSKHVHMPALSAVMTWIYVVFAKEIRSTNRTSRGAGLRRFPCLYFPAPRAQNAPKTSCLCLLLRAVYGHFALVDLPQSRKFSPCGALPPAALRGRPDSTRPGSM